MKHLLKFNTSKTINKFNKLNKHYCTNNHKFSHVVSDVISFGMHDKLDMILDNLPSYLQDDKYKIISSLQILKLCDNHNMKNIPDWFLNNPDLCVELVGKNPDAINHVPQNLLNKQFYIDIINNDHEIIDHINHEIMDYDMWLTAVKEYGYYLKKVPMKFRDYHMCLAAIINDGQCIPYIPDNILTKELCMIGLKHNPFRLYLVPEKLKDYVMYVLVYNSRCAQARNHIPKEIIAQIQRNN